MHEFVAAVVGVVAVAGYLYRADFEKYSIFTVGQFKRIERLEARSGHECLDCGAPADNGEHRRFYEEIVLFGAPVVRNGGGVHHYCEDHASFEFLELGERTERTSTRLVTVLVQLIAGSTESPTVADDSPFANTTASVGSAINLAPVVLLVLVAAVVLKVMQPVVGAR